MYSQISCTKQNLVRCPVVTGQLEFPFLLLVLASKIHVCGWPIGSHSRGESDSLRSELAGTVTVYPVIDHQVVQLQPKKTFLFTL